LLRQFIRECRGGSYRWLPPNRRYISKGLYLPGRKQEIFRGIVALDTSGSTVDQLPEFAGEVDKLLRSFGKFKLTVLECDTAVRNVTEITSEQPSYYWNTHRFSGGGGTDFTPVFEYIRRKRLRPEVLIFFTDGDGRCPKNRPEYPVLWLLTDDGEAPVEWGFTVKMKG
jgi:predicted metal-dependent peptidase